MNISNIAGGLVAVYGGYKFVTAKNDADKRNGVIALSAGVALLAMEFFSSEIPKSCEEKFYAFWKSRGWSTEGIEHLADTARLQGESMGDLQCRHFMYEWKDPIAPSSLKVFERISPEDLSENWMWGMYIPKYSSILKTIEAGKEIDFEKVIQPFFAAKMTRVIKSTHDMLPGTDLFYSDSGVATIYTVGKQFFNRLALNFERSDLLEHFPFNPATNQSAWRGMIDFINKGEVISKVGNHEISYHLG